MTRSTVGRRRTAPPQNLHEYLAGPPAVSQRQLAAAVGCNQSMISMLVRGMRVPSAALAVQLHAVTGVPLKHLLATKIGAPPPPTRRARAPNRGSPPRQRVSP